MLRRSSNDGFLKRQLEMTGWSVYQKLFWIVLLAFATRVAVRGYLGAEDFWRNGYTLFFRLAQDIGSGHGIVTAARVPLYPAFLAAVTLGDKLFLPILIAQSLIGAGTVWCAALIAKETFGIAAILPAALITAIYPYYVVHDTALQETSLFTFLTGLGVLLLLQSRRTGSIFATGSAGLTLGAAVLTRASLAPFAALAPLWLALAMRSHGGLCRHMGWRALLCAGLLTLTVSPWLVWSYSLTGTATLSTSAGYMLWVGNNPYTFSSYPNGSIDRSRDVAFEALSLEDKAQIDVRRGNEASVDEWFRKKGLQFIREHPWQSLRGGFRKLAAAFGWLPSPHRGFWPSLIHAASYGTVMGLGLWEMWTSRRQWREHLIFYLLFLSFAAVTVIFFGHTSHRSYLDLYWIVFAAGALVRLNDLSRKRCPGPT